MKLKALIILIVWALSSASAQPVLLYYNNQGQLTIQEMASHYRVVTFDSLHRRFVGKALDYALDSTLINTVLYDNSGNIASIQQTENSRYQKMFELSMTEVESRKSNFEQAIYIRKNDYPILASVLKKEIQENIEIVVNESGRVRGPNDCGIVEDQASFPGGLDNLSVFLSYYLMYPEEAAEQNITGQVYVQFVIYEDGTLNDIKAVKGLGYGCDEAAEYAVSKLPDWLPGRQWCKPVKVRLVLPITFQ